MVRSCIKLYGPRISEGLSALEAMVKELREESAYGRMMTRLDPLMDIMTQQMIQDGEEALGEYDFVIEWRQSPPRENLDRLIAKIDRILAPSGCRYTITTKK